MPFLTHFPLFHFLIFIFTHSFSCKLQKYKHGFLYFWPSVKRAKKTFLKVGSAPEQSPRLAQHLYLYTKNRDCHCTNLNCARSQVTPALICSFQYFFFYIKTNNKKNQKICKMAKATMNKLVPAAAPSGQQSTDLPSPTTWPVPLPAPHHFENVLKVIKYLIYKKAGQGFPGHRGIQIQINSQL